MGQVIITRWYTEEFSRGAYSYLPPGASGEDYDELAAPVAARLFFAGRRSRLSPYGRVGLQCIDLVLCFVHHRRSHESTASCDGGRGLRQRATGGSLGGRSCIILSRSNFCFGRLQAERIKMLYGTHELESDQEEEEAHDVGGQEEPHDSESSTMNSGEAHEPTSLPEVREGSGDAMERDGDGHCQNQEAMDGESADGMARSVATKRCRLAKRKRREALASKDGDEPSPDNNAPDASPQDEAGGPRDDPDVSDSEEGVRLDPSAVEKEDESEADVMETGQEEEERRPLAKRRRSRGSRRTGESAEAQERPPHEPGQQEATHQAADDRQAEAASELDRQMNPASPGASPTRQKPVRLARRRRIHDHSQGD